MTQEPSAEPVETDGLDTRAMAAIVRSRLFDDAVPYRIGRFTVLERLGAGGMGVVYGAFDAELDRRVAVKVLARSEDTEHGRIIREAKAMAKLAHPNVAHVYEVGTHGGHTYVAMEHVRGRTLREWRAERPRSWREVLAMYVQAGRGLAAAHAAGVVHRDFKPDNVLVGADERARVVDFGLARIAEDPTPAVDSSIEVAIETSDGASTRTGAVLGTPAYMAPEHARGEIVDARGDQFAFCVALWEALAGARPFAGSTPTELVLAAEEGRIVAAPRGAMPGFLAIELRRGLAASPADRHASVEALLDRLGRDPTATRRRVLVVAAVAVLIAGGLGVHNLDRMRDERACEDAGRAIDEDWNESRATALAHAFAATELGYADDTWTRAQARIEAFAEGWRAEREATCIAALDAAPEPRVDGCFTERRAHLAALLDQLEHPDAGVVQQAVTSAAALPSPHACADPRGTMLGDRVPAEMRAELARISVLRQTGRFDDAAAAVQVLREDVARNGPEAAQPDVDLALGMVENSRGHYDEARAALERSFYAAGAAGADETMLVAARMLIDTVGYRLAEIEQGLRWYALARMLVARLGLEDHPEVAAMENHAGLVHDLAGAYDEALAAHERALGIRERVLGSDHPDVAGSLFNIGIIHAKRGALDEALAAYRRSLALDEASLGPDHPHVAGTLNSIGHVLTERGDLKESQSVLERALAIKERVHGPMHPSIGSTVIGLGNIHAQLGRTEEALVQFRRARAVFEATLGANHPNLAAALKSEANTLTAGGRPAEAPPLLERALAIEEEVLGPDHVDLAGTIAGIGNAQLEAGELDAALASLERAGALVEKALGPDHGDLALLLSNVAAIHAEQGRLEQALAAAERSARIYERNGSHAYASTQVQFLLAKLLWDLERGRDRAVALAREARGTLVGFGPSRAADLEEIDAWLASHAGL